MTEKSIIELINQLFEIEKKSKQFAYDKIDRNLVLTQQKETKRKYFRCL